MSLPESVQALNDQITVTMNNDIQGGGGQEALSADTMVTSIANQHLGNLDGDPKQSKFSFQVVLKIKCLNAKNALSAW